MANSLRAATTLFLALLVLLLIETSILPDAEAKKRKKSSPNPRYAAYVVDAKTGKVLFSRNADARRYPASLTKMMTLYLVFEDLKSGRINLKTRLVMSKAGWRREPSKLGLKPGQTISMEQAIYALVTKSANDVATAIGDQLSGSEAKFALRMTRKARQLGMKNTTFKNANGLTAKGQITTAADMAKLGLALREHFPKRYSYFKTRVFKFGKRRYKNHNRLLGKVKGVDGIKTGYTRASGFNLVSSASSNGRSIVAVVMGGRTGRSRNAHMESLIHTYLPKASRGGSGKLVPGAVSSSGGYINGDSIPASITRSEVGYYLNLIPASKTPKPQFRDTDPPVTVPSTLPTPTETPTPTPSSSSSNLIDRMPTSSIASAKRAADWQIQITATDDRNKALAMLIKARNGNQDLLASVSPAAERIVKNGAILYRARFTGFSSKAAARNACKVLKKQKFSCLALSG